MAVYKDALGQEQIYGAKGKVINGGELFSQDLGGGQTYERFVDRPEGYTNEQIIPAPAGEKFAGGANASNIAYVDKFGVARDSKGNPVSQSSLIPSNTNISQGTNDIEDATSALSKGVSGEENAANNIDLGTAFSDLQSKYNSLNTNTDAELKQIEAAGAAAGGAYDSLISTAISERRQGMAKDLIRAGEKGGFMSTQQAGISALVPTEGGDWYGAGGNLERQKSVYDNKITELQRLRLEAIDNAKAAARKAIKTGKLEDIQAGKDMLEMARNIVNDMRQAETDKANLALKKTDTAWNVMKDLGEGQTVDINGVTYTGAAAKKPFFTSSEITQIMLKLNKGESVTITDPNTGEDMTITGILDQAEKTTTLVDDKGYAHVINTQTGKEIAKSSTPVGKTKAAGTSVNVTMPSYGNMQTVRNKAGNILGTQRYDSKSGKIIRQDINGKEIVGDWPSDATFDKPDEGGDITVE